VDALAGRGDERRTRLRKASGSCQEALIRGFLNGATQHGAIHVTLSRGRTQGSETSQYLKEEKSNEIPKVAASEMGLGQLVIAYLLGEGSGKFQQRG
jgi:hypothetical protein